MSLVGKGLKQIQFNSSCLQLILTIGYSKKNRENYQGKCFITKETETLVKI